MKYLKLYESDWAEKVLSSTKENYLAMVEDEYYKMVVNDIDFKGTDVILSVTLSDNELEGKGYFKYTKSKIEGLSGDITPVKMEGILEELWYEDNEIIFEFINKLIDELKIN